MKLIYDILLRIASIIPLVSLGFLAFEMVLGDGDNYFRYSKKAFLYSLGGFVCLWAIPHVIGYFYGAAASVHPETSDTELTEKFLSALPYVLGVLVFLTVVGTAAGVVKHIHSKHSDYADYIASLNDTVPLTFSVFEGAYSRNPSAWTLHAKYAERDGQICVFSYSDFKRYARFLQRMEKAEKEHNEAKKKAEELSAIQEQRTSFENDPCAYLQLPAPQIAISFPEAQDAYDVLMEDVAAFREKQLHKGIIADYGTVRR